MRQTTEKLLWILVIAAIFWVAASDPWFIDNWLRIVLIVALFTGIGVFAFYAGMDYGIKVANKKADTITLKSYIKPKR